MRAEKGDNDSIPFLRHAIELDPNFALAHSYLGSVLSGDPQREEMDRAYNLRERLTKRQYVELLSAYLEQVTGELEKAEKEWTQAIQIYPTDARLHSHLAYTLNALGKYPDAAAEAREAIRLEPTNFIHYVRLMYAETAMARYAEANAAFKEARSHGVDEKDLRLLRYASALLENDNGEMQEQLKVLRQMAPSYASVAQAWTEISVGHLKSYRQLWFTEGILKKPPGDDNDYRPGLFLVQQAIAEEEIGDFASATRSAKEALALSSDRTVKLHAAYALARSGEAAQAQQLARELKEELPDDTAIKNYEPCIGAAIAINQNAMDKAADILRTSCPNNPAQPVVSPSSINWRYIRGLVYLKRHEAERAVTAFQSVIDHPGTAQMLIGPFLGALARVQLGRAYAMMGDKDAARKSYQDFLTLWKDADPDIPIYKQAKAEYAKLLAISN